MVGHLRQGERMVTERIIAESDVRQRWRAWFADRPEAIASAHWPDLAVCRLLDSQPDRLLDFDTLVQDDACCRDGHLEFIPAGSLTRIRRIPR